MFIAFFFFFNNLPEGVGFFIALSISGSMGKLDAINFSFDIKERYTFWTGITGGFFLALSYFGTDQSQVQRYLSGKNIKESRMGLMFNAIVKIPMQYFILLTGVMVFVFYQFQEHNLLFDQTTRNEIQQSANADEYNNLENEAAKVFELKKEKLAEAVILKDNDPSEYNVKINEAKDLESKYQNYRSDAKALVIETFPNHSTKDSDYVFLSFIMNYLPNGLIGLLLAVIISAAMSSTAGELNALGSTTTIDFYKRVINQNASGKHYVKTSKLLTLFWGVMAIMFALFAQLLENLIEAVNILGSVFYGTILGVFLVAFIFKKVKGNSVFIATLISQAIVFIIFANTDIAYLLFNLIGRFSVISLSLIISAIRRDENSITLNKKD